MTAHAAFAVLTVEVNPGEIPDVLPPLQREDAEKLGHAMARDLQRLIDGLEQYGLVAIGGFYDSTELLRPGLPVFQAMADLYRSAMPQGGFQPSIMSIGAQGDSFPLNGLEPSTATDSSPLLLIPFAVVGEEQSMDHLRQQLETRLLEKGQGSVETGRVIENSAGLRPHNLFYATLDDLCALMRVQLDHAGFTGLWDLIDAALFPRSEPVRCLLDEGHCFLGHHNVAYTRHVRYRSWRQRQSGQTPEALITQYGQWHRRQRQYVAGLAAHGLSVCHVPDQADNDPLLNDDLQQAFAHAQMAALMPEQPVLHDCLLDGPLDAAVDLTLRRYSLPELGPVLFTIEARDADGGLVFAQHDYPLRPDAVESVPQQWQQQAKRLGLQLHREDIAGLPEDDAASGTAGD